jgi:hypothetical protein
MAANNNRDNRELSKKALAHLEKCRDEAIRALANDTIQSAASTIF